MYMYMYIHSSSKHNMTRLVEQTLQHTATHCNTLRNMGTYNVSTCRARHDSIICDFMPSARIELLVLYNTQQNMETYNVSTCRA